MSGRFKPRLASWPIDPVFRKLRSLARLSDSEETLIRALSDRRERYSPGEELLAEGEPTRRARLVVSGWAASQRVLPDGRRQIFHFILPGDLLGYAPRPCPSSQCSLTALTSLETIDAELVVDAAETGRAPGLAQALVGYQLQESQLVLDHMVRLGQQTAYERVAHFLLELQRRLQVVGLGDGQRFPLPLTQEMLADALGLSIVHVNRTLQTLRRDGLIELRSGVAILLRPDALSTLCDYDTMGAMRHSPAPQAAKMPA